MCVDPWTTEFSVVLQPGYKEVSIPYWERLGIRLNPSGPKRTDVAAVYDPETKQIILRSEGFSLTAFVAAMGNHLFYYLSEDPEAAPTMRRLYPISDPAETDAVRERFVRDYVTFQEHRDPSAYPESTSVPLVPELTDFFEKFTIDPDQQ